MEQARTRLADAEVEGSTRCLSGHSCRVLGAARVVALAAGVTLVGCRTTHELGRLDDPAEVARLQEVVAGGRAYAVLDAPVIAKDRGAPTRPAFALPPRHRVAAVSREGVQLQLRPPSATLLPGAQLQYIAKLDRWRGARDGALIGGVPMFLIATSVIFAYVNGLENCSDGCSNKPDPFAVGLTVGTAVGVVSAAIGAGLGALVGHEDRYVPAAPGSKVW